MFKKSLSIIVCLVLLFTNPVATVSPARAAVTSCSATVSPTSMLPSTLYNLNFAVTNTSEDPIVWVRITRPSANFSLDSAGGDWDVDGAAESYTFHNGTIAATESHTFILQSTAGATEIAAQNWTVEASGSADGSDPISCTGTLGVSISSSASPSEIAPAVISSIAASGITSSTTTITWTTNKNTNAQVDYGLTDAYGLVASDATQTTSHSIALAGLSASTTYYYRVQVVDSLDNTTVSGTNTFVTAAASTTTTTTTTTTTVTVTVTVTPTPTTATPTPTIVPDNQLPKVSLTTDLTQPYKKAPKLAGIATDNKEITSVDYSTDGGKNWLPVDTLKETTSKNFAFDFTPLPLEDDNYLVKVRAKDATGNVGLSEDYTLVIDRLPPQVGANLIAVGPQPLYPNAEGNIVAIAGVNEKIYLDSVGGPTSINLVSKGQTFSLVKDIDSSLWSGTLSFQKEGNYTLTAKSIDGAKNQTSRQLNNIIVLKKGLIKSKQGAVLDAQISAYYFDKTSGEFVLWDGAPYEQKNPQKVDKNGQYQFFLPPGRFYILVKAPSFKTLKTEIFELTSSSPINTDLNLEKATSFKIGSLVINLPDLGQSTATISLPTESGAPKQVSKLIGKELPNLNLFAESQVNLGTDFLGKPTVVTVLNSWAPQAASQINILGDLLDAGEVNAVVVVPQESSSAVQIYKKRGDYQIPILADPDGLLVPLINFSTQPTHLFVNRKGIVVNTKVGIFTREELLDSLLK